MKHDYNLTDDSIDSSTTGTTGRFGVINVHEPGGSGLVERVVIRSSGGTGQAGPKASFQVFVDGSALFSNDIRHTASAGTWQTFIPGQNRHFAGANVTTLFSVATSASAAASATAALLIDDGREDT